MCWNKYNQMYDKVYSSGIHDSWNQSPELLMWQCCGTNHIERASIACAFLVLGLVYSKAKEIKSVWDSHNIDVFSIGRNRGRLHLYNQFGLFQNFSRNEVSWAWDELKSDTFNARCGNSLKTSEVFYMKIFNNFYALRERFLYLKAWNLLFWFFSYKDIRKSLAYLSKR
jgi:hypothetical protein